MSAEWKTSDLLKDPDARLFWSCQACERPNFVGTEPRCGQCGRPPAWVGDRVRCAIAGTAVNAVALRALSVALRDARVVKTHLDQSAGAPELAALSAALHEAALEADLALMRLVGQLAAA